MELHAALEGEEAVNFNTIVISLPIMQLHLREYVWSVDVGFHCTLRQVDMMPALYPLQKGGSSPCDTLHL